jgi:O-Antigen ligase
MTSTPFADTSRDAATPVAVKWLLIALVAATFVTRYRVPAFGVHLQPEHFIAVALLIALLVAGTRARLRLWKAATDRTVLLLAAFVVWEAAVSFTRAPEPGSSMTIVGWLCLDLVILATCIAAVDDSNTLERYGVSFAVVAAVVAVGIWIGSLLLYPDTYQLTNLPHKPLFGTAWEANILASTLAAWAFVCLSSADSFLRKYTKLFLPVLLIVLIATFTRAALPALAVGVLIWVAWTFPRARRWVLGGVAVLAVAVGAAFAVAPSQVGDAVSGQYNANVKARTTSADQALNDLERDPGNLVLGSGANSFGQRHADTDLSTRGGRGYIPILPLQILYDGGLVGIVLLALAVWSMRPLRRSNPGRAVGLLAIYLLASALTSPFWFGTTWVLIALAVLTRPHEDRATVPSATPPSKSSEQLEQSAEAVTAPDSMGASAK